ncbi:MAG: hypothetical protein WCH76_08065 [Candidatus Riflemargulisbacteria bacterium]
MKKLFIVFCLFFCLIGQASTPHFLGDSYKEVKNNIPKDATKIEIEKLRNISYMQGSTRYSYKFGYFSSTYSLPVSEIERLIKVESMTITFSCDSDEEIIRTFKGCLKMGDNTKTDFIEQTMNECLKTGDFRKLEANSWFFQSDSLTMVLKLQGRSVSFNIMERKTITVDKKGRRIN